jgi:hypothetical protein
MNTSDLHRSAEGDYFQVDPTTTVPMITASREFKVFLEGYYVAYTAVLYCNNSVPAILYCSNQDRCTAHVGAVHPLLLEGPVYHVVWILELRLFCHAKAHSHIDHSFDRHH